MSSIYNTSGDVKINHFGQFCVEQHLKEPNYLTTVTKECVDVTFILSSALLFVGFAPTMRELWVQKPTVISERWYSMHYGDVIMGTIASQITSLTIVYSTVYWDADQRKHQSSTALAFVRGIHRWPVNSPHKWPVTRKMFPFDDVIMKNTFNSPPLSSINVIFNSDCI